MTATMRPRRSALFLSLVATDLRNVVRDGLMATIIIAPLAVALIFRAFVPGSDQLAATLAPYLGNLLASDLALAAPMLLMSLLMAIAPGLVGAVYGLLLVDERDQRTLQVLRVMPMPFAHYMATRMITPLGLSVAMTIAAYPIADLAPLPIGAVVMLAVVGATSAPMVSLAMAAFARDKVAALAIMRVVSSVLALPVLAYFATPPILYLAWFSPAYWQMKALWLAADAAPFALTLGMALVLNLILALLLYARFEQRSGA
ncbi:MAG: hypothetical protein A4S17_00725 [Proteobacteria bacterium HN_bin10]|nr:MAG: hypothetical protein A4S17_00725 [Proteobacteria bacterium HN_bin10]